MSRSLLARITPAPAKRAHERAGRALHLRRIDALNRRFAAEHGLEVRRGPFAGLRYPDALVAGHGDLVAKLVGTYELELAPVLEAWIGHGVERFVDVGAAEGFYAVGMAVASPATRVVAFELDPAARAQLAVLAEHNGVGDRVEIRGACTPAELAALRGDGVAVLSDCEGGEAALLDPVAAPALTRWPLLVELHEFVVPGVTETLRRRFAPTHDVELIDGRPRDGERPPELRGVGERDRARLLGERRPGPMQWMRLRPREPADA